MTKIYKEMFFAIHEFGPKEGSVTPENEFDKELKRQATAAAEVCKVYIERAFDAGYNRCWHGEYGATQAPSLTEFLKSEGITE